MVFLCVIERGVRQGNTTLFSQWGIPAEIKIDLFFVKSSFAMARVSLLLGLFQLAFL